MGLTSEVVRRAQQVAEACAARGAQARLLGGVAVYLRCPSATRTELSREYQDVDFVVRRASVQRFSQACQDAGFTPDRHFNALHGERRLVFADDELQLDAFVELFQQCHKLNFAGRLDEPGVTVSLADLLLTKLQVVEINQKDLVDVVTVLLDHEPVRAQDASALNVQELEKVLSGNWGFYTTVMDNLQRLPAVAREILPDADAQRVAARADSLREALEQSPKSLAWTARSRIGRRMPWYELPEEKSR